MEENLEIERDAVPPRIPKKRAPVPDFKMEITSFEEKLREHFEHSSGRPHTLLPAVMAKLAVPIYFFTITATWCLGMFEVMPVLYKDYEDSALFNQRVFMVIIYLELMSNWLCIRYVDSSYLLYLKKQWMRKVKDAPLREVSSNQNGGDPSAMKMMENGSATGYWHQNGVNGFNKSDSSNSQTPWKPPFRPSQQTSYPYWSWVPCYVCEVMRPPRCHHCPICQTCVLKRDHHCFFAGSCVGWRNQRHFLIFGIWATFACSYASFYGVTFFLSELWPGMRWFDLLAPITLCRCVFGYVSAMTCFCVWVQSLLLYFLILSSTFVQEHVQLIYWGMTSFEVTSLKKTIELRDSRSLGAKIRSVLGKWWLLNLLLPLHWLLEAQDDPENWPSIKIYRH